MVSNFHKKKEAMNIKAFGPRQARWVDERPASMGWWGSETGAWCAKTGDQNVAGMWCPINRSFGNYLEIFGDAHVVKIPGQMPTLPDHAQFMPGTKSTRRSSWQQTRLHNITFRPLKLQQLQYPRPWGDRVQVGSLKKDGSRNPYQTHKTSNNHPIGPVLFVRPRGTIWHTRPFFHIWNWNGILTWLMSLLRVGARNLFPVSFWIPSGQGLKINAQRTVEESPLRRES